jgi:hypothetical protein
MFPQRKLSDSIPLQPAVEARAAIYASKDSILRIVLMTSGFRGELLLHRFPDSMPPGESPFARRSRSLLRSQPILQIAAARLTDNQRYRQNRSNARSSELPV